MSVILDVNVLLALSLPNHVHHGTATGWFAGVDSWLTTPPTECGYLRLMSNPHVAGFEISPGQALAALRAMRALPGHRFLGDDSSLVDPIIDLAPLGGTKQVTDFHLVNLAARHRHRLATFDAALARSLAPPDRRHLLVIAD